MTTQEQYTIKPYTPADNAGLADMWNASDDQWPGTFTGGVPLTTERVTKWMNEEVCLLRLVVKTGNGQVVGYGSLRDLPGRETQSAYVPLLNIQPHHQGNSLCRQMLTQMVDHATAIGYERLTLGTWAANIKSVPLYKKVGFFWEPDTNVSMSNYIPLVRQLGVLGGFFDRADWYTDYKRTLELEEDEQTHPHFGEQSVFISRWEKEATFVEATFDGKAQTLTGLETERFALFAKAETDEPAQGLSYSMTWTVVNKSHEPLTIGLAVEADEGIEVAGNWSGVVPAGATHTHTAPYTCSTQAPSIKLANWRPKPTPQIKSQFTLNGQPLVLGTGLHYKQAVTLTTHPELPEWLPGRGHPLLLQLQNQLDRPLQGTLTTANQTHPFQLPAKGRAGVPVTVSAEQTGQLAVNVTWAEDDRPTTDDGRNRQPPTASRRPPAASHDHPLPTIHFPLLSRPLGQVAAIQMDNTIWLANDFFTMKVEQEAGRVEVRNKVGLDSPMWFREELGLPFEPADCEKKLYEMTLDAQPGRVTLTLTVHSTRFPGLVCTRHLTLTPAPLIHMQHTLHNTSQQTHTVTVMSRIRFADSEIERLSVALPRHERIVLDNGTQLPTQAGDFPRQPADIPEQWACYSIEGQSLGAVWPANSQEHQLYSGFLALHSAQQVLPAGQTTTLDPVHIYNGPGTWQDVRRLWQQLTGQPQSSPPPTGPAQQITTRPGTLLTLANQVNLDIQVENLRDLALNGQLTVSPPAGWQANHTHIPITNLTQKAPFTQPLQLTRLSDNATNLGPAQGNLHLNGTLNNLTAPLNLIRLGDDSQQVQTTLAPDGHNWNLNNGHTHFTITPNFHGGISAWGDAQSDNHLHTPYPKPGMLDWMSPWMGGIWPTIRYDADDWANLPGKFHQSNFVTTPTSHKDDHALLWQGVKLTTSPTIKRLEGLHTEISYLTLPGSNVLKLIFRVINPTSVHRRATPTFFLFCNIDGGLENGVLVSDQLTRKRTPSDNWSIVKHWGAVVNPDTGRAMMVVCPSGRDQVVLMDCGNYGAHIWLENDTLIPPHSHHDLIGYMALANSLDQARQYAVLKK